jgi:AmmeMemoRadiSam system protein A
MHALAELAKKSVETYVRDGRIIELPSALSPDMSQKSGVFVCIKKDRQLRGCIGTFVPTKDSLMSETIMNAISAATNDPRFPPVQENELDALEYTVDVLSSPEKVADQSQLDPKRYGVIVSSGQRRGLLLPDLEGVNTVEEQLNIAKMKAGIPPGEETEIYRFEVKRYQ